MKAKLREQFLKQRLSLDPSVLASRSATLCEHLAEARPFLAARKVALYKSFRNEVDLHPLLTLAPGKTYFLPKIDVTSKTMEFYRYGGQESLTQNAWGLFEPDGHGERLAADADTLIVVPGLAFDKKGYRLGYGKGFYDRYLSGKMLMAIGVCLAEFVIESLPAETHDQAVQDVITDHGPLFSRP